MFFIKRYLQFLQKQTIAFFLILLASIAHSAKPLNYTIIDTQPHYAQTFTQGFIVQGEYLVETSGLYGKSFIQKYHANTNELVWRKPLPPAIFAEGLTKIQNTYYILSWKKGQLLRFDSQTMQPKPTLYYKGEGWGLTHNNKQLIMSDGSHRLFYKDPVTFKTTHSINVTLNNKKITHLNELEYAQNSIFSNVWLHNTVIRIDPHTGIVTGLLNLTGLAEKNNLGLRDAVLNGIAYDRKRDAFWITGKYWPKRYLIKLHD